MPSGISGLLIVGGLLLFACVGPFVSAHAPDAIDLAGRLQPPDHNHWLGTDELGRDLFSRIAHGTGPSLLAAVAVVGITLVVGTVAGGLAGLVSGWFDAILMRVIDVMLSIPALVLAMALAAALGPSLINALIALLIVRLPVFIRLARGQTLSLAQNHYIEAARLMGARPMYLLRNHVIPGISGIMLVQGLSDMAGIILAAAALGFIGLGAQPPSPEWGGLVATGRHFVGEAWWYGIFPGLAILGAAAGFNLLADAARDILDPKTRS